MISLIFIAVMIYSADKTFAQTTYTWNQTGTASWATATNWSPTRTTPAVNDKLVFDNAATTTVTAVPTQNIGQLIVMNSTVVNLQAAAANNILSITGGTGTDFSVTTASQLNINGTNSLQIIVSTGTTGVITGNMTFSGAAHKLDAADAAGISFNSPAVFTQDVGCTGSVFTTTGTANAIVFASGSTFVQKIGDSPFGLTGPNSKIVLLTGNLFKIKQNTLYLDRKFANLEFDLITGLTYIGGGLVNTDNFTMTNGILNLSNDGGVIIRGNLSVAAGATLTFNSVVSFPDTITFNGTSVQAISNAGTLTFGNTEAIVVNNAAGININNNITFNNQVKFISGIITIPNPIVFTLGATATVTGVSNNSFVDGRVTKTGNTAFTFPVGKTTCGPAGNVKGYAALAIANFTGGAATDKFTAEYKRGNALSLGAITALGLNHISACDYWTLTRDNGSSKVDITLSWNNPINNCSTVPYIDNPPSLTIAHNNNTGGSTWNTMAVAGATSGTNTAGTVTWNGVQSSSFGAFAIGSIDFLNPLPITINYFTGNKLANKNVLGWKVEGNSTQTLTLILERSTDSRNFNSIYTVAADVIRCTQPFNYIDAQPPEGISYYRLKMTDFTGKTTYSNLVALLNAEDGFSLTGISPNPVAGKIVKLQISSAKSYTASISITDMMGKVLEKKTVKLVAGFNTIDINSSEVSAGTYIISVAINGYRAKAIRFVKL